MSLRKLGISPSFVDLRFYVQPPFNFFFSVKARSLEAMHQPLLSLNSLENSISLEAGYTKRLLFCIMSVFFTFIIFLQ